MKHLLKLAKENKLLICIYLLSGFFIAFLNNFKTNYFQYLIDSLNDNSLVAKSIFIYGITLTIFFIMNYIDEYPGRKLEHGIFLGLKLKALKKISKIDYQRYQTLGTGKLVQKIENGAYAGKGILFDFWFCLFRELVPSILFSMIFIYRINRTIMAVILVGYIIVFVITNILLKKLYKIKEKILLNEEQMNHYLIRGFMEMPVFRINKRFNKEIEKAANAKKVIVNSKVKMTLIHEAFFTIFAFLITIIEISTIFYAWKTKLISIGGVVALVTLIGNAYTPIAIFNVLYVQYKLDKTAFDRYTDFLDEKEDNQLAVGTNIDKLSGNINIKELEFCYENRIIFDNLNLHINSGDSIAFVGESGSGKSTLIKLLTGFLKPRKGAIFVDSYDLNNVNLNSYYDSIVYISQESPIFDGTLRENLLFDNDMDEEQIKDVLEKVELLDLFNKLDSGLDTELGERGTTLSGGERQRLALARLWFSNANIIIFDEATSALDNITEENVMNHVMTQLRNKTVIVIAHRLNTIKNFERIIAFKEGKIVGQGSFNELLNNNQYFNELYYANTEGEKLR